MIIVWRKWWLIRNSSGPQDSTVTLHYSKHELKITTFMPFGNSHGPVRTTLVVARPRKQRSSDKVPDKCIEMAAVSLMRRRQFQDIAEPNS